MAAGNDPVAELEEALRRVDAVAKLVRGRMAPSTLYDADYHLAMIACAFSMHANSDNGVRKILRGWLKLLQFVAARPRLLPDLLRWAGTRSSPDLETWRRMPRGYVGDQTHDAVVDLLIAHHALVEHTEYIMAGPAVQALDQLHERIRSENLFVTEREVMDELKSVRMTRTMLGGA